MLLRSQANLSSTFEILPLYGRVLHTLRQQNMWISPYMIYNYFCMDDKMSSELFQQELSKRGIQFEKFVIEDISRRYNFNIPTISTTISDKTFEKTVTCMKNGFPFIHSAPLISYKDRIRGVADLLVRSDYLHLLTDTDVTGHCVWSDSYCYVVVDIKFKTFQLKTDKKTPYKSNTIDAYTNQLFAYNKILGEIQGYTPNTAFLMGRRYKWVSKNVNMVDYKYDDRLVEIDFTKYDVSVFDKVVRCIKNNTTLKIPKSLKEITQVWNVSVKHHDLLLKQNIRSIYDTRCSIDTMNISGKIASTIQQILDVNQTNHHPILPHAKKSIHIQRYSQEFYIDFEIIPETLDDKVNTRQCNRKSFLFLIGLGWEEAGEWNYRSFLMNEMTTMNERRLVMDLLEFIPEGSTLYHWGCIEPITWNKLMHEHNIEQVEQFNWIDLSKLFIDTPITINGCFNFKLKSVAGAMYKHHMISSEWKEGTLTGMDYSTLAYLQYQKNSINKTIMNDIIDYNEMDCRVLWEILTFLHNYYK